ncbi:HK97 family phage prohead protease [Leeuwenhoekiella aequorea]|uniref:HK97 family phage prohead protease n=1 Tax=Leeuwenhoekiella aequorea TaxID=283736 RepID=UPI00352E5201|tara:strand:+ start:17554 stop:18231 length:678 start_codon:yes stop_codon:yes gene_type:complete
MEKITKSRDTIVKEVGDKGLVTLQISQHNKFDSDDDRMMNGAFVYTFKHGKQVHLLDHKVGTSTLVGLPVRKDSENLVIDSQLNLDKVVARELLSDYKFGLKHDRSLQHSQGFIPVKDKYKKNEKGGFDFYEVNMKEYSTVVFGAESDTPIHAIKDDKTALWYVDMLEKRCAFGFLTDEKGKEIENHILKIKSLLNDASNESQSNGTTEAAKSTSHYLMFNFKNV